MDIFSSSRDNRRFDWGAFIAGILMVVAAFVLLRHPAKGLHAFVLIFAIISIVQGLVSRSKTGLRYWPVQLSLT